MPHNQNFVYATRDYASRLNGCSEMVETNPQRVMDVCGQVRSLLSVDARLKGHREVTGMIENQVDLLEELARQKMYSPEH